MLDVYPTLISIHAPAKGATSIADYLGVSVGISIHAPAKGATPRRRYAFFILAYFNPRSREGSDNKDS